LFQKSLSTSSTDKFYELVNEFIIVSRLEGFKASTACFAIAGPIVNSRGYQKVKMTNSKISVDTRELKAKTPIGTIFLINDFEAISYATNILKKADYIILNKGRAMRGSTRAVLGAGTGLGKGILYYNDAMKIYFPLASEGGNTDLPISNKKELEMVEYIKKSKRLKYNVAYEDLLSGPGLEQLYKYLQRTKYKTVPKDLGAIKIAQTKKTNPCSRETFNWFIKFYARCARNFSLDTLAQGGLYIAGGIAAKNADSFKKFYPEFIKNNTYQKILEKIPIHLITNYDISLLGAAFALKANNFI
jgi:glucokinase